MMLKRGSFLFCTFVLTASLASYAALPPGRPLPDVPMEGPGNTTVNPREYRSKVVVLAILSITCDHCITAAEILTRIQKEFGPRGVQVIGAIADDNPKATVPPFVARYRINFPVGFVYPASIQKLASLPPGMRPYVPILLFVDGKGMVRQQIYGNDPFMVNAKMEGTIRDTLAQLLNPPPAPAKKK